MTIATDGKVGIGTTSPQTKLHIEDRTHNTGSGDGLIPGLSGNTANNKPQECLRLTNSYNYNGNGPLLRFTNYHASGSNPSNDEYNLGGIAGYDVRRDWGGGLCFFTAPNTINGGDLTARMVIDDSGQVGIGTTSPGYPLHVYGSTTVNAGSVGYLNSSGAASTGSANSDPVGLRVENAIWTGNIVMASSDRRIKENIVDTPDNLALQQVRNIPCRYYEYRDKVSRGSEKTIGFIAQEVKSVLPMAVSIQTGIIPSVYKVISCEWTGNVMYSQELGTVSGVKYKFYVSNTNDDEVEKIVTGSSDNTFTFEQQWNNVFCYGREVDDFHTVDKNKLFALNFSATQELDRQQQADKAKITSLETKVASLESELAAIKAHLGL